MTLDEVTDKLMMFVEGLIDHLPPDQKLLIIDRLIELLEAYQDGVE